MLKHSISGDAGRDCISYVSAIANSGGGHLVIGVQDQLTDIVGIQDRADYTKDNIKARITGNCLNLDTENFHVEEFQCTDSAKVVWILHIPKHTFRQPVIAHTRAYQRLGDSIAQMTKERVNAIINEPTPTPDDWTAITLPRATMDHLDEDAIAQARKQYNARNNHEEQWDDRKFLEKMGLIINGQITRAAILLFGNQDAEHLIGHNYQIRWNLRSAIGNDRDYDIFTIPYFTAVHKVYAKIRNFKLPELIEGTLNTTGKLQYEPFVIREALNNAIAHQDYTHHSMINVTEVEDERLVFLNAGTFLPRSVREVVLRDAPEPTYRNPLLASAMRKLAMVDQQGGGIRKMFLYQCDRCFPLPEYDMSNPSRVLLTITGKTLNDKFAKILTTNPNLSLDDIFLLDMVQKGKPLTAEAVKHLRKNKYVEGRVTQLFLSHKAVTEIGNDELRNEYIENKFDNQYFMEMIVRRLKEHGPAGRKIIEAMLLPKLPSRLTQEQKIARIDYLIRKLREKNIITRTDGKNWIFSG